ncbi:NAD(P)/FAD-dependent oxidoreductase [Streptomyces rapamycinicus]|uniref:FAD-dependent oxidoreductase n=2 Tax=Streptomyces rapamycinicus TaxID=1226757 RepID=A0A0A0NGQ1_STRRN|nr:tryptophan 7-halogenase [Streptomyces rapamycinicus]AGP53580.1 FAD-dependent oxidoreductase [Streptomyces rapamycinicus NRRL 5491]MBB4781060.1 FADH2 O2-dependent halogenase [Streptomyces rapamycinicus]RLV74294.1 FAD-dependent oxidoreductase [Streptomyces rapamycinicus NRRL 5491]UTO61720.1 tryptophan 7-halogenase [Streptomyces rapamycinicus]UTP29673.1 tryptophan 7-halogenase [Streptomyces rapamycinicus NRRL 5491]
MQNSRGAQGRADTYDVAILGSGMAGGMLGAVLARNGVRVLLLDAGTHPRFAVGESTIPYTSGMTRIIADRYRVPELKPLSSHKGISRQVSRYCGQKQNFGFVYHRAGTPQNPREINQLVVPSAIRTETHLFRQDVDSYLFHTAVKYGAEPLLNTRITDVDIDPASGAVLRTEHGREFRASYIVDGSGFRSPLAEKFALRETTTRARTHSRSLFTHMIGVRPFDQAPAAREHDQPNPWHHGTLHHVFDGGWLWVIPFDNHADSLNPLCSVGLTLDPRVLPKEDTPPQAEFDAFLRRFPQIAWQFQDARPVRPWVSTGRLQYSAKQVVGDRFCLTSHAAGFIDALYSRGLTNTLELVNALGWRLIAAARDGDWSTERFSYLETLQQGLFDFHDDLVFSSFVGFGDYELWNAVNRTWMLGTMLGNVMLEDAYHRFTRSGDTEVFRELEDSAHPGSPLPVSQGFNAMSALTRDLCIQVDEGSLAPREAARRILECVREADFVAPSFRLGLRDTRCFNMSPGKMAKNAVWCRRDAPEEIGQRMINASKGLVRMRLLGG